jgi:hypothetical protein
MGPIIKTLAYNHTQDNHSDTISGIRTPAIEIVNVFEMEFRWEKDILIITAAACTKFHKLPKNIMTFFRKRLIFKYVLIF